jgi:hypothetical protein
MIGRIRTAEDHNDEGLGLPPFPRKHTGLSRDSFDVSGSDLVLTHTLLPETSAIRIAFVPSATVARLYGPADVGVSRILPNVVEGFSVLDDRDIPLKVSGLEEDTSFEIDIWEY